MIPNVNKIRLSGMGWGRSEFGCESYEPIGMLMTGLRAIYLENDGRTVNDC